jgi:hypothetical protein
MAKPTPTLPQQAAIQAEIAALTNQQASLVDSAAAQGPIIAQKQLIDNAFKDLFAWYNVNVIGKYDAERKAINGSFIVAPITETDILNVAASPPTGRLVPTPPATAIIRIAEFDGTAYTGLDPLNELQHLTDEEPWITYLQTGVAGTLPTVTLTSQTSTALTPTSTTLDLSDSTGPMVVTAGDVIVVHDGGTNAAVVKVLTATAGMGTPPPYTYTLTIQMMIAPASTIASGSTILAGFTGFTNPERSAKVASDPNLQPIMNTLISKLEAPLNARLPTLAAQITALNTNEDPDGVADINTAKTNAIAAQTFINNYLLTTDISNVGLASVTTERSNRTTYLNTRITQIITAYTGQTENYYDARYNTANSRGDTVKGSLRALSNAQNVQTVLTNLSASITSQIASLNGILP